MRTIFKRHVPRGLFRLFCSSNDSLVKKAEKIIPFNDLQRNVFKKLSEYNQEYQKITSILNLPEDQQPPEAAEAKQKINSVMAKNGQYEIFKEWLTEVSGLAAMADDPSMKELVEEEKSSLEEQLEEITYTAIEVMLEKDKYDDCSSTIIEFRPGVGGGESMIFAEEMLTTYRSYCALQGWRVEVLGLNKDTSVGKGIKSATIRVSGHEAYVKLKCESGVHK